MCDGCGVGEERRRSEVRELSVANEQGILELLKSQNTAVSCCYDTEDSSPETNKTIKLCHFLK